MRAYREQERRDKADTAVVQAARSRVRAELRKRQIVRQKGRVRRGVYLWVTWALQKEPPTGRRVSVAYRLPPQCGLGRATRRSINLEPLTGRGHISKPELQQISPKCLYAYGMKGKRPVHAAIY